MMRKYEELTSAACEKGFFVAEYPFCHTDGMVRGHRIGIRAGQTETEKACVLAEEIAHAELTVGNILDQNDVSNRQQELRARIAAYDRLIGLAGLIAAHLHGCQNRYEAAEFLGVTEKFLAEAVECYRKKYGNGVMKGKYLIMFEPTLAVIEFFK